MARWFLDRSPQHGIPSVSLRRLLPDARFLGCRDLVVSGCSADSRRIHPGEVFVALRGEFVDGHAFIPKAVERGASGVVAEAECAEAGQLQIIVPDSHEAHARIRQALAGDPADRQPLCAVAGGRGRTATIHFLKAIHDAHGDRVGLLGAHEWSDGQNTFSTPDTSGAIGEILASIVECRCGSILIEATERDLARRSHAGLSLQTCVVLPLDRSGRTEEQARALRRDTARLIHRVLPGGASVVCADDPDADLLGGLNLDSRLISFGFHARAMIRPSSIDRRASGFQMTIAGLEREISVRLGIVGPDAILSALAAAAAAHSQGIPAETIAAGLESASAIPGLAQRVDCGQPFAVWLQRHTAGLAETLNALRELTPGRLHLVLSVSPATVVESVESLVDRLLLTVDNPFAPEGVVALDEARDRLVRPGRARIELDRRRAIELSLAIAALGDSVLIVGSPLVRRPGHVRPLPDRKIVETCLQSLRDTGRKSIA
jgi:UDP-N-acetylmuramoyl-L-alanyl-D-glutamate--2,6-diaminopimelate ligase